MELALVPIFLAIGCVVGFLAGLLGIGGGMTIVPLLTLIFSHAALSAGAHPAHGGGDVDWRRSCSPRSRACARTTAHGAVVWPVVWKLGAGNPGRIAGRPADRQRHVDGAAVGRFRGRSRLHRDQHAARPQAQADARAARHRRACSPSARASASSSSMVGAGGAFPLGAVHDRVQRRDPQRRGDLRRARTADRRRRHRRVS